MKSRTNHFKLSFPCLLYLCSVHSLLRPLFKVHSFFQSALETRLSTADTTIFLVFVISLITDQRQPANVQNSLARCQHPVTVTQHPPLVSLTFPRVHCAATLKPRHPLHVTGRGVGSHTQHHTHTTSLSSNSNNNPTGPDKVFAHTAGVRASSLPVSAAHVSALSFGWAGQSCRYLATGTGAGAEGQSGD